MASTTSWTITDQDDILAPAIRVSHVDSQPVPAVDEVLPGLRLGKVAGLVAPGGVGKSMFALELGIDLALPGSRLTGLDIKKHGATLIVAAEEDAVDFHERLKPMLAGLSGRQKVALDENLHFVPLESMLDIMDDRWLKAVVARARKVGARLVVLDTLRRMHSLNEISPEDMAKVIGRMELVASLSGASVMYLHHASKAAIQAGQEAKQSDVRGTTVLVDNVKFVAMLSTVAEAEVVKLGLAPDVEFVRFTVVKSNRGQRRSHLLARQPDGMLLPVETPIAVTNPPAPAAGESREAFVTRRRNAALAEMDRRREAMLAGEACQAQQTQAAKGSSRARPF